MSLRDLKIPNFKFPKLRMKDIENIEEVNMEIDPNKITGKNKKHEYYEETNYSTIKEIFIQNMEKYKENVFVLEKQEHKEPYKKITYEKFCADVINFGTGITRFLNIENERIIIIGETSYNWYVSYMALLCGAGIAVPIDSQLPSNEIENLIVRSKATVVIYSKKKKDVISKLQDNLPGVKYFVEMYCQDTVHGRNVGFNYILDEGEKIVKSGDNSFLEIKINPEEFKLLIFTSGTTSASKGVMICNRNLAENINSVNPYVKIYDTDRFFSLLPLHHTYESTIGFLLPFERGASIAICEGLKHIVPDLQQTHPSCMLAVPLLVENLHKKINKSIEKSGKAPLVNSMIHVTNALKTVGVDLKKKVFKEILDNLGGNLRIIVSAAAPIDPKVGKWVQDMGIAFLQGYGLTETAPIAALTPDFDPRVGSAGKAVLPDEIKIHNPNENKEGEVWIKGKTVMMGYYENEEATKEVMYDGWFNSGDIGYLDKDGYLYITGRSKNVIVTQNGKNIYPEELELMLGKVPEIKECMVYGKEVEGEKELLLSVKVIPSLEDIEELHGKDLSEEQIHKIIWEEIKKINKQVTSYKAIKNLEIKKDEFQKTTTMKIKRFEEIKKDKQK